MGASVVVVVGSRVVVVVTSTTAVVGVGSRVVVVAAVLEVDSGMVVDDEISIPANTPDDPPHAAARTDIDSTIASGLTLGLDGGITRGIDGGFNTLRNVRITSRVYD